MILRFTFKTSTHTFTNLIFEMQLLLQTDSKKKKKKKISKKKCALLTVYVIRDILKIYQMNNNI